MRKWIIESTPGGYSQFYDRWKAAQPKPELSRFEQEYPVFVGIDLAKPDSDRTVQWSAVDGLTWSVIDDPFAPAEAMENAEEKRNAHIWDMIVLAAESSRYEK